MGDEGKPQGNPNETEYVWGKLLDVWKHHMEIYCPITNIEAIYFRGH